MTTTNNAFDVKATITAIADSVKNGMSPTDAIANSDYGIADRAEKARIRGAFKARFDSAMRAGEFDSAKPNWEIHAAFANASRNSTRETVSNSDELRTVVRYMAYTLSELVSGNVAPNGMDSVDLSDEFEFTFEFTGEYDGDAPELDNELVSRFVPKRITRNAPTNDIAELVGNAMSEFPVGEFVKVSDLRKRIPNADSGWDGRIVARLFPDGNASGSDCTIPNVDGAIRESDGRKGAIRTA